MLRTLAESEYPFAVPKSTELTIYSLLIYWDPDGLKGELPEAPEVERQRNVDCTANLELLMALQRLI